MTKVAIRTCPPVVEPAPFTESDEDVRSPTNVALPTTTRRSHSASNPRRRARDQAVLTRGRLTGCAPKKSVDREFVGPLQITKEEATKPGYRCPSMCTDCQEHLVNQTDLMIEGDPRGQNFALHVRVHILIPWIFLIKLLRNLLRSLSKSCSRRTFLLVCHSRSQWEADSPYVYTFGLEKKTKIVKTGDLGGQYRLVPCILRTMSRILPRCYGWKKNCTN